MHKNQCCLGGVISTLGLHGGLQFRFKNGGEVIFPVFLEFTGKNIGSSITKSTFFKDIAGLLLQTPSKWSGWTVFIQKLGQLVNLSDFHGKMYILLFFATY